MCEIFLDLENLDVGFDFIKYELSVGWLCVIVNCGLFLMVGLC